MKKKTQKSRAVQDAALGLHVHLLHTIVEGTLFLRCRS